MPSQNVANPAVLPVFVESRLLPDKTSPYQMCVANEEITGPATIDCCMLRNGIWHVHTFTEPSRVKLLTSDIKVGDKTFRYESFNPNVQRDGGEEREGTKLTVSNLPLSYSNLSVEKKFNGGRFQTQIKNSV